MTPQEAQKLIGQMEGDRKRREAQLRKLSKWLCPWRGRFDGQEGQDIYEREGLEYFTSIASDAVLRGASGMTSGMTPRNISWFKPDFLDPQMLEAAGARAWLDQVDRQMKETLSGGGFYQAIQNFNIDLLWSGAGLLYTESGHDNILDFYCVQPGSYLVQTNIKGELEACARLIYFTAAECKRRFGEDALSESTKRKTARRPFEAVPVWHLCLPLDKPDGARAIGSYYLEKNCRDRFLRQGSYYEMPYFFAVWNDGATSYGTGPGDNVLADAMQIDTLERAKLAGIAKLVDPPVQAPPELKDVVDLSPGAINYLNASQMIRPILDLSPYASSMQHIQNEIMAVSRRLEKGLMASVFSSMPLDQRPAGMSATEFLERKRDALQQLGPIMSAYEPLVLTPMLVRVCNALKREGILPPEPESLRQYQVFMKMDFISPMANALRQTGAETTRALATDVANLAQMSQDPAVLDKLNLDQIVDELATGLGAPGNVVRSDEEVAQIREEREKQRQEAQAAQAMQGLAGQAQGPADALPQEMAGM